MYKKCIGKEKIYYVDFTSLYPSLQKDFKYPVGHPSILIGKQCDNVDFDNLIGIVKCDILPPKHLYFSVLPSKINSKLFVLCYSCAVETHHSTSIAHQHKCHHAHEQHMLSGV